MTAGEAMRWKKRVFRTSADTENELPRSQLIVGDLDGSGGYAGANFQEVTYFINVDKLAHPIAIPALASRNFVLHPVHLAAGAADTRAAQATYDPATGTFTIPPRTAVVFVVPQ